MSRLRRDPPGSRKPIMTSFSTSPGSPSAWPELVQRLRDGETSAMEDLYQVFYAGIRFHLWRHVGPQDMTDRLHDIFLIVTESIRSGELREPERLMGYVRT